MQWQDEAAALNTQLEEEIYAGQEAEQTRLQLAEALAPLQEQLESHKLARHEAESACDLQRSRLRQAERMAQESRFAVQAVQTRMQDSRRRDDDLQQRRETVVERLESLTLELEASTKATLMSLPGRHQSAQRTRTFAGRRARCAQWLCPADARPGSRTPTYRSRNGTGA